MQSDSAQRRARSGYGESGRQSSPQTTAAADYAENDQPEIGSPEFGCQRRNAVCEIVAGIKEVKFEAVKKIERTF